MNRRSFITGVAGILSAGYAPAFVGSSVLMPVKKIWTPVEFYGVGGFYGDYYFDGYYFHKSGPEMIVTTKLQNLARWD